MSVNKLPVLKPDVSRGIFSRMWHTIAELFRPEEVEVTFRSDGNRVTYTYTKAASGKVA